MPSEECAEWVESHVAFLIALDASTSATQTANGTLQLLPLFGDFCDDGLHLGLPAHRHGRSVHKPLLLAPRDWLEAIQLTHDALNTMAATNQPNSAELRNADRILDVGLGNPECTSNMGPT